MQNEITVYWSPAAFPKEDRSWNMLYREPEPLFADINKIKEGGSQRDTMLACPASNRFFKNLYVVKSNLSDSCEFPINDLIDINNNFIQKTQFPYFGSKVSFAMNRKSALEGYLNLTYNLMWIFFAEEPLEARFTAPYYPPQTPIEKSMLTSGIFDIGQWFRPYGLEYMVPYSSNKFLIEENDPLFYIEFLTDKKINFKRFTYTKDAMNLVEEFIGAPDSYGRSWSLSKRYEMAKRSKVLDLVLKEIKNNLVD